jgi:hypothetical protein
MDEPLDPDLYDTPEGRLISDLTDLIEQALAVVVRREVLDRLGEIADLCERAAAKARAGVRAP